MNSGGIKRILVALDASEANRGALQAASLLASQLHAELQALFVEDINLFHLAELPFAREMLLGSREGRRMTTANLERQIQAQVARLRSLVETTALQNRIKVEFKVLRGQISNELRLAAQHIDLLVLGKSNQLLQHSLKLGKIAQDVLTTTACNVLLLQYGATLEYPVAVFFDGSPASQRALQLAAQLARGNQDQLHIIFPPVATVELTTLQAQTVSMTHALGIDAAQACLTANTPEALLQATVNCNARVLLIGGMAEGFTPQSLSNLIQQSRLPVIVMR